MDENTAVVLALQLVALFSVAGALLMYLLCQLRSSSREDSCITYPGASKPVLVTCCDNVAGLQIALNLAERGYRVFAGLKCLTEGNENSVPCRVIRSWQKSKESTPKLKPGTLVPVPFDVTREDVLREAVDLIRAQLPAGYDGIWAILNTASVCYRGRLDQQDVLHWDFMLRLNVIGTLRTVRTFQGLLRSASGRVVTIGADAESCGAGLVAYAASRYAVDGAIAALGKELQQQGIATSVVTCRGFAPEAMSSTPRMERKPEECALDVDDIEEFQPKIFSKCHINTILSAISATNLKDTYFIDAKDKWFSPNALYSLIKS